MLTKFKKGSVWYYGNVKNTLIKDRIVVIVSNDNVNSKSYKVNVMPISFNKYDENNIPIEISGNNLKHIHTTLKEKMYIQYTEIQSVEVNYLNEFIGILDNNIIAKLNEKMAQQFDVISTQKIALDKMKNYVDNYINNNDGNFVSVEKFFNEIEKRIANKNSKYIPTQHTNFSKTPSEGNKPMQKPINKNISINNKTNTPQNTFSKPSNITNSKIKNNVLNKIDTTKAIKDNKIYRLHNYELTKPELLEMLNAYHRGEKDMLLKKYDNLTSVSLSKVIYYIKKHCLTDEELKQYSKKSPYIQQVKG